MYRMSSSGASAPAIALHSDAKANRLFHEHKKLLSCARNYAYATPGIVLLGEDPVVDQIAASIGFHAHDLAILSLSVDGRLVTAVCAPTRLWRDPEAKNKLFQLKAEALAARTHCILVPQRWLRAEVRSTNARTVAQARNTRCSRDQVRIVLDYLRVNKISTIVAAAGVLRDHPDPYAVILAMTAEGLIHFDRSGPLRADTWIAARL